MTGIFYVAVAQRGGTILVYPEDEGVNMHEHLPVKAAVYFRSEMVKRGVSLFV